MTSRVDTTAARATGLLGAVTSRALSVAGRLALTGVSTGLHALETSQAVRKTVERYGDTALQIAAATPLGRLLPAQTPRDDADAEARRIAAAARQNGSTAAEPPTRSVTRPRPATATRPAEPTRPATATRPAEPTRPAAATRPAAPARRAPDDANRTAKPSARGNEPHHSTAAEQAGAPGVASAAADAVVDELVATADVPATPTRDELPLADYDSATLASLRARLRSLSVEDLAVLREYEQAHAHRLPVMTMLDNRIAKVSAADSSHS